jgi:uncharacterized protein
MAIDPHFEFEVAADADLGPHLLVGFAGHGMASLAAVDHLVDDLGTDQVGHARASGVPAVTPFVGGRPRHPTRVYAGEGPGLVVSERFLPAGPGEAFADAVWELARDRGVEEVTVLYSVTYPHGPEEHAVFSVATEDYPDERLADAEVAPLGGGFLDGAVGRLLGRGLDDGPAVATLVTPAHPPGPDFEGAILLLEAVAACYDLAVDTSELRSRSEEIRTHYQELADRMQAMDEDPPEDRMYM